MAFKDTYRLEKVYYENIYTLLNTLKSMKGSEVDFDTVRELLDNAIADNESIIIIYKNLGELYNEISIRFGEIGKELADLKENLEQWKDEINDKIDENHNYIMGLIREIEQRLDAIEADLATMSRNHILDLVRENNSYHLELKGETVSFSDISEMVEFPHDICVRGNVNGETTEFRLREFDTDPNSGVIEFYVEGLIDNLIHEITVTVLPDDSVNVSTDVQHGYTAGTGIVIENWTIRCTVPDLTQEVNALTQAQNGLADRVTNAEEDIDTLEATAENLQENKQDKLTAGSGIAIDPNTNEISATGGSDIWAKKASGDYANIFNDIDGQYPNIATGNYSHAEGYYTQALANNAHAEGRSTKAEGAYSHSEGVSTVSGADASHAEGESCEALGLRSHAEGMRCKAIGSSSHAEGYSTFAYGSNSHVEGNNSITGVINDNTKGITAHAEGYTTHAIGECSHSEGLSTIASGRQAHAEGSECEANGDNSHAEGLVTLANGANQHVSGKYNVADTTSLEIIGNGSSTLRSNARTLDASGNEWLAGQIQPENGIRLKDSNGVYYNLTVDTSGNLVVTPV